MIPLIYIGLTGWGDHDDLYEGVSQKGKLSNYASYFPIVEVDSSFYAIQPIRNYEKWVKETPDSFQFVVKAYQGMTGHQRGQIPFESTNEMFDAFTDSISPLLENNKLAMVLFQFPPWFDCKKENVQILRYCKQKLAGFPLALEFRHQSWFVPEYRRQTLQFMKDEGWIHSICDEPQAGSGSVPIVLEPTDEKKTLVRFHGRNIYGWKDQGNGNWREVRYLYNYSTSELMEWKERLIQLQTLTKDVYLLFNNNSGGDAAKNAFEMLQLLDISYQGLAPRQLGLFD